MTIIVVQSIFEVKYGWGGVSYCVSCGELLLCADDSTATLGSVESSFSSNDGLTLTG